MRRGLGGSPIAIAVAYKGGLLFSNRYATLDEVFIDLFQSPCGVDKLAFGSVGWGFLYLVHSCL